MALTVAPLRITHKLLRPTTFPRLARQKSTNLTKFSYFHNPGKGPFKHITVGNLLRQTAQRWPDRIALISQAENKSATFEEVEMQSNKLASGLMKIGLKPGDKLGIISPNCYYYYITSLAAAKIGVILVNINPASEKQELEYCLEKACVKSLIISEPFKNQHFYDSITSIESEISNTLPCSNFTSKRLPHLNSVISMSEDILTGTWRMKDLMIDDFSVLYNVESQIQPDDPYNIQFSSGTTGKPKAALLNHFTLINNSNIYGLNNGFDSMHHTVCLQVPLFHTFGMSLGVIGALNHGMTLVMPAPSFSASLTIETLKVNRCSIIYGTPTMYIDLCNQIQQRVKDDHILCQALKNFHLIVVGGAICSPSLFKRIIETFNCSNVASAYGMTECSPILMGSSSRDTTEQRSCTVGRVADHTEVKVVDDKGKMVPFGSPGEGWFRGYSTMLGYFGDKEKTEELVDNSRWVKTGDIMILTPDGYGQIVGRKKDVIIRGGENIFPGEIEECLESHPDIQEAQVYGVSDERTGEAVCTSILLKDSRSKLNEVIIQNFCKGKISHFKIPKYVKIVKDFPKTASGKIQKYKLKEMMEKELNLQK